MGDAIFTRCISGPSILPVGKGGTGGSSAKSARTNLGVMTETLLYRNSSGTISTITLSDSYKNYDYILEIAKEHDVVMSLANAMRAGAIADSTDRAQVQELIILGELVDRAREAGVQTMIEGPGHIPINEIPANVTIQKKLCSGAPFYMLGPIVCDVAPGYDHIVSAIGAAESAKAGADFICYVTPAEHLALPSPQDVKDGVIATRIGAYAGDMAKGVHNGEKDLLMADARKALDWEAQYNLAICPDDARAKRDARPPEDSDACTMCGDFCAVKIVNEWLDQSDSDVFKTH